MTGVGYRTIAIELRAAIERGEYRPGEAIPTLADLMARYGVGKETARRAVGLLRSEGLVVPVRRRGTVVRDRTPVRLAVDRYAEVIRPGPGGGPWETACAQQGVRGHTELVATEQVPATGQLAAALEVPESTQVLHRRHHMYAGSQVAQVQDAWLPITVVEGTTLAGTGKVVGGMYRALATIGHSPASATETVVSRMPTSAEAETLSLDVGSPVVAIERVTRGHDGHVLLLTHAVADGARVQLIYGQHFPR